jgi:hypothetical protein
MYIWKRFYCTILFAPRTAAPPPHCPPRAFRVLPLCHAARLLRGARASPGDWEVTAGDYACMSPPEALRAPKPSMRCRPRPGPTACAGSTLSTRFMRPLRRTPRPPRATRASTGLLARVEEGGEDEAGEGRASSGKAVAEARAQTMGSFLAEFLATLCPSTTTAGCFEKMKDGLRGRGRNRREMTSSEEGEALPNAVPWAASIAALHLTRQRRGSPKRSHATGASPLPTKARRGRN